MYNLINKYAYALFIGLVMVGMYPPKILLDYVFANEPCDDIKNIKQAVDVIKGAPDMLNSMVRSMSIQFLLKG